MALDTKNDIHGLV